MFPNDYKNCNNMHWGLELVLHCAAQLMIQYRRVVDLNAATVLLGGIAPPVFLSVHHFEKVN